MEPTNRCVATCSTANPSGTRRCWTAGEPPGAPAPVAAARATGEPAPSFAASTVVTADSLASAAAANAAVSSALAAGGLEGDATDPRSGAALVRFAGAAGAADAAGTADAAGAVGGCGTLAAWAAEGTRAGGCRSVSFAASTAGFSRDTDGALPANISACRWSASVWRATKSGYRPIDLACGQRLSENDGRSQFVADVAKDRQLASVTITELFCFLSMTTMRMASPALVPSRFVTATASRLRPERNWRLTSNVWMPCEAAPRPTCTPLTYNSKASSAAMARCPEVVVGSETVLRK